MTTDHDTPGEAPSLPENERRLAQRQRDALRSLHAEVLDEPIPAAMLDTIRHATSNRQRQAQWWRWGGMAASVVLAFGAGWLSHGSVASDGAADGPGGGASPLAFARQAAVAHVVYSVEQRHPVEVSAAEQEHLVHWLSKRLGKPLKAPVLDGEGFELMGGRLLPGGDGARAQFMYQGNGGQRLTLYVGVLPPAAAAGPSSEETAFRFTDEGPVPGFYWVDKGFGYALSGALPRDQLAHLARRIYEQL